MVLASDGLWDELSNQDVSVIFKNLKRREKKKPQLIIDKLIDEIERPLIGVVKYSDGTVKENDLIGFRPGSEYEFIVDKKRLYRVLSNFITIKYEYQGNEETYNPSWA